MSFFWGLAGQAFSPKFFLCNLSRSPKRKFNSAPQTSFSQCSFRFQLPTSPTACLSEILGPSFCCRVCCKFSCRPFTFSFPQAPSPIIWSAKKTEDGTFQNPFCGVLDMTSVALFPKSDPFCFWSLQERTVGQRQGQVSKFNLQYLALNLFCFFEWRLKTIPWVSKSLFYFHEMCDSLVLGSLFHAR